MFAVLGFLLVGELTHMRSMCVGVAETGVEHRSPAKNHKVTFLLLALLSDKKRGKSHLRGLFPPVSATPTNALRALVNSPLLKNTLRVHESVARAMRGKCVRQMAERKSAILPLPVISTIPRVRTYHTR